MITLLGGFLADDSEIFDALRAGVARLREHQTDLGAIPNHVDIDSGRVNFRAYADGGLWFVIGSSIIDPDLDAIEQALDWYRYQDVDSSGVLSMQEASDWQDLFCVRGKTLYLNCLYTAALRRGVLAATQAGRCDVAERWSARAGQVARRINELFWYKGDGNTLRHVSHSFSTPDSGQDSLGRKRWIPPKRILSSEHYYLPYLSFRDIGEWFDTFGNLMAILSGVADELRTAKILDFIERHGVAGYPAKAIHPPVRPGDADWREYYGPLNAPHQYHNGGVWPFLGGFYVAALVKAGRTESASAALGRLARLNLDGDFNEWHHGETLQPCGVKRQAWSAGMFLYAAECVRRGTTPHFD